MTGYTIAFLLLWWLVSFIILKVKKSDKVFGAFCTGFLIVFFGGGMVLKLIELSTGMVLL